MIPFNKPYLTGREIAYMQEALNNGQISGNGVFTKKCELFLSEKLNVKKCLLATSCTDALEMCAMLADVKQGDEVIVPSYTFVSSALAFVRQGAKIIFADSRDDNPCIDETKLETLITEKTKVLVVVHYAGIACDMDVVMAIAERHHLIVVEDAAQALDSYYKGRPLGSIGHLSTFSFHETKNIQCGEGGMLAINDERFVARAEVLWEKGTNRAEFFRGEINKYGWVDVGSSFLPAEYVAAFLWAQFEAMDNIQQRRKIIWEQYYRGLQDIEEITLPYIPISATNNAHIFYLICASLEIRTSLISYLKGLNIQTVFHYLALHQSDFIRKNGYEVQCLPNADRYTSCLLRLPLFYDQKDEEVQSVINGVRAFFKK